MNNNNHRDLSVDVNQSQGDLDFPDTRKYTTEGRNSKLCYAVTAMQGWRDDMEDAHTILLKLDQSAVDDKSDAYFAVYDGHVGDAVANFVSERLHHRLRELESYKQGNYRQALTDAFLQTDDDILHDLVPRGSIYDPEVLFTKGMMFGSCAVSALITSDNRLFVANLGDSRAVLGSKGTAIPLSTDAKPTHESELKRIQRAGGMVMGGRILGSLAVSRAFGDFAIKAVNDGLSRNPEDRVVSCVPDITEHPLTDDDEFLIIACDGIWDVLSSQQAIDVVRLFVSQGKPLPEICEAVCELCLAPDTNEGPRGTDNMSIIVIALFNGLTVEDWYKRITDRVNRGDGYQTPDTLPSPFSKERMEAFKVERARRAV